MSGSRKWGTTWGWSSENVFKCFKVRKTRAWWSRLRWWRSWLESPNHPIKPKMKIWRKLRLNCSKYMRFLKIRSRPTSSSSGRMSEKSASTYKRRLKSVTNQSKRSGRHCRRTSTRRKKLQDCAKWTEMSSCRAEITTRHSRSKRFGWPSRRSTREPTA